MEAGAMPATTKPAQVSEEDLAAYLHQRQVMASATQLLNPLVGGIASKAPKMIRLFRGEGRMAPEGPFWRDPEMNALSGRWFTTNRETAETFAAEAKSRRLGPGRVVSVDVPEHVYEASRLDNLPKLQKFRYGLAEPGDALLPQEWVQRAMPMVTP